MKDHSENRTENRTNNCKNQSQNRTTNQTTNEHNRLLHFSKELFLELYHLLYRQL